MRGPGGTPSPLQYSPGLQRFAMTKRIGYGLSLLGLLGILVVFVTGLAGIGRGKPVFLYNFLDMERFKWEGSSLSAGKHTILSNFKYDGPGPAKGGTGVLTRCSCPSTRPSTLAVIRAPRWTTSRIRCRSTLPGQSTSSLTTSDLSSYRQKIKRPLRKYSQQPRIRWIALNTRG
jgi:hypothetical protein